MIGNSLVAIADSMRQSENFNESKEIINTQLMGQLAHLLIAKTYNSTDMSNLERKKTSGSIVKIANEYSRSVRGGKASASSGMLQKNNFSSSHKPTYVDGSVFVPRRALISNPKTMNRHQMRRQSMPATTTHSLQIHDLKDNTVVCEKNFHHPLTIDNASTKNAKSQENSLPPLAKQFDYLTPQTGHSRIHTAKERYRSLSGQGPNTKIETISKKNQKSASIDYSSMGLQSLLQLNSRSSSFTSGKYSSSQTNSKSECKSPGFEMQLKTNSARSAYSAGGRKKNSSQQKPNVLPSSTLEMVNGVAKSGSDISIPLENVPGRFKSKRDNRSNSVYSPLSAISTDMLSRNVKDFARRRASLPNTSIVSNLLVKETTRSPEFFKTFKELKVEKSLPVKVKKNEPNRNISSRLSSSSRSSTREPQRCDILQKIEEVMPEVHPETAQQHEKELSVEVNNKTEMNSEVQKTGEKLGKPADPVVETIKEMKQGPAVSPGLFSQTEPKKSSKFFAPDISLADLQNVNSEPKTKEIISDREENRHLLVEQDCYEKADVKLSPILNCLNDSDSDFIDDSVIFKVDDDLCDDDFHEKRIILWLKEIKIGEEATQTTRVTPPPSPDLSAQESAIRVVYKGDG